MLEQQLKHPREEEEGNAEQQGIREIVSETSSHSSFIMIVTLLIMTMMMMEMM